VQAKKLKGNNCGSDQNGKSHNKSWKNKAKGETDDSKKELASLVKKATLINDNSSPSNRQTTRDEMQRP